MSADFLKIFISYRRLDSAGYALYVYEKLCLDYGRANVFYDVDSLYPSDEFPQKIDEALRQCAAAVVVIGPQWVTMTDARGARRLDDDRDFVRIEIETALRQHVPLFPLLVERAVMPSAAVLPGSLKQLAEFQAFELHSGGEWEHTSKFLAALKHVIVPRPVSKPLPIHADPPKARRVELHWEALLVVARTAANSSTVDVRVPLSSAISSFATWASEKRWNGAEAALKKGMETSHYTGGLEIAAHELRLAFDKMQFASELGFLSDVFTSKRSREHTRLANITAIFETICHIALDNHANARNAYERAVACYRSYDNRLNALAPYASSGADVQHAWLAVEINNHYDQKPYIRAVFDIFLNWTESRVQRP